MALAGRAYCVKEWALVAGRWWRFCASASTVRALVEPVALVPTSPLDGAARGGGGGGSALVEPVAVVEALVQPVAVVEALVQPVAAWCWRFCTPSTGWPLSGAGGPVALVPILDGTARGGALVGRWRAVAGRSGALAGQSPGEAVATVGPVVLRWWSRWRGLVVEAVAGGSAHWWGRAVAVLVQPVALVAAWSRCRRGRWRWRFCASASTVEPVGIGISQIRRAGRERSGRRGAGAGGGNGGAGGSALAVVEALVALVVAALVEVLRTRGRTALVSSAIWPPHGGSAHEGAHGLAAVAVSTGRLVAVAGPWRWRSSRRWC